VYLTPMALTSTLYRFRISLSDVERSLYRDFDLRIAKHPSENDAYMLTRLLAYCLSYEEGLEFTPGLCEDGEPAIFVRDHSNGGYSLWIEIGNPAARRLHKASKACANVLVYTYKDPANLLQSLKGEKIHRLEEIHAFALEPNFISMLANKLERDNEWTIFRQEGDLTVAVGEESFSSVLTQVALQSSTH
jgi:uncharacterized protein YaeQ